MAFKVIITPPAQHRLDMYIGYTVNTLKNRQAAKAILDDARLTKNKLSEIADSLSPCMNHILSKYGYKKILFQKHQFLMIFRIHNDTVIVDGMYHELQDYESLFINEMHLQ